VDWVASFGENGLAVRTGAKDAEGEEITVSIDHDGNQRMGLSIEEFRIDLVDFIHVQGSFFFEKGPQQLVTLSTNLPGFILDTPLGELIHPFIDGVLQSGLGLELSEDYGTLAGWDVATMLFGGHDLDVFVGFGDPDFNQADWSSEDGLFGFVMEGVDFGLAVMESTLPDAIRSLALGALDRFMAAKITAERVGFVGGGEVFQLEANGVEVLMNWNSGEWPLGFGRPVIDWKESFPGADGAEAGLRIPTGAKDASGEDITVNMDLDGRSRIAVTIDDAIFRVYSFIYLRGSLFFEYGTTFDAKIALPFVEGQTIPGVTTTQLKSLTIAAQDLHAFIGVGGPYWNDSNEDGEITNADTPDADGALGLVVDDLDFAMMILEPTLSIDKVTYFSVKASAEQVAFVGIDFITAELNHLNVELNFGFNKYLSFIDPRAINWVATVPANPAEGKPAGYEIELPDSSVFMDFTGFLIKVQFAGTFEFRFPGTEVEMFGLDGVFLMSVSFDEISLFVDASLRIGPPDLRLLEMSAIGGLVLNDQGFAADIDITASVGAGSVLEDLINVDIHARLTLNALGNRQEIPIPDSFLEYLSEDALDRLQEKPDGSMVFVIPEGAPQLDGSIGAAGPYLVMTFAASIELGGLITVAANLRFELSTERLQLQIVGVGEIELLGQLDVFGFLEISEDGLVGALDMTLRAGVGGLGISFTAQFKLELNTGSQSRNLQRPIINKETGELTGEFEEIVLAGQTFRVFAFGELVILDVVTIRGQFELTISPDGLNIAVDGFIELGFLGHVEVEADFELGPNGLLARLELELEFGEDFGIVFSGSGLLEFNSTGSVKNLNGHDLDPGILVRIDGQLDFLGFVTATGYAEIQIKPDEFRIALGVTFELGPLSVSAEGVGILNSQGIVLKLDVDVSGDIGSVIVLEASGKLKINTTDEVREGINPGTFAMSLSGKLELFSVLKIESSFELIIENYAWYFAVSASLDFFGIGSLSIEGSVNSEGEFFFGIEGEIGIGAAGFGIFGSAGFSLGYGDSNGTMLNGDGNYIIEFHGHVSASIQLAGITLAGISLTFDYNSGSGEITVEACIEIFLIFDTLEICVTFSVGFLRTPPPGEPASLESGGVLRLNMGDRASMRGYATDVKEEFYKVKYVEDDPNGGIVVDVSAMGRSKRYSGVRSIVADAGDGFDYIEIGDRVSVPVTINGGLQDDIIDFKGSGPLTVIFTEGFAVNPGDATDRRLVPFGNDTIKGAPNAVLDFSNIQFGMNGTTNDTSGLLTGVVSQRYLLDGDTVSLLGPDEVVDTVPFITKAGDRSVTMDRSKITGLKLGSGNDNITIEGVANRTITVQDAGGTDNLTFGAFNNTTVNYTDNGGDKDQVNLSLNSTGGQLVVNRNEISARSGKILFNNGLDGIKITDSAANTILANTDNFGVSDLGPVKLEIIANYILANEIQAGGIVLTGTRNIFLTKDLHARNNGDIRVSTTGATSSLYLPTVLMSSSGMSKDGLGSGVLSFFAKDGDIWNESTVFRAAAGHLQLSGKGFAAPIVSTVGALTAATTASGPKADIIVRETDSLEVIGLNLAAFSGPANAGVVSNFGIIDIRLGLQSGAYGYGDHLLDVSSGTLGTVAAAKNITIHAGDIHFKGGVNSVFGTGTLEMRPLNSVWNYYLGAAGEQANGSDLEAATRSNAMELSMRDIAALRDGFTSVTIGRAASGNYMEIGDAFASTVIKATTEARPLDASLKDNYRLHTDVLRVNGDVRAPNDILEINARTMFVTRNNVHVPDGLPDSGLAAKDLRLNITEQAHLLGWLIGYDNLTLNIMGTTGVANLYDAPVGLNSFRMDIGSRLETRNASSRAVINTSAGVEIAGMVEVRGVSAVFDGNAGTYFDLVESGIISARDTNSLADISAGDVVRIRPGSAVLAGARFDYIGDTPVPVKTAEGADVVITSPHELYIGGTVTSADGMLLQSGTPIYNHADYFDALIRPFDPEHYLLGQSTYAIFLEGTLTTLANNSTLRLAVQNDVIIRGNINALGNNSGVILQSDKWVYVEGFVIATQFVKIYGGVSEAGANLNGANTRGASVYVHTTSRVITSAAGSSIDVRGGQDVELYGAMVAGGVIGATGVDFNAPGASIYAEAGQQLWIETGLLASGRVEVKGGTPGLDDLNLVGDPLGLYIGTAGGLTSGGKGAGGLGGLVKITGTGDFEMLGNINAGGRVVQTFSPSGVFIGETIVWSGETTRVEIAVDGRAWIGGYTHNAGGAIITTGGYIRASDSVTITGGTHSSDVGLLIDPVSEITVNNPNGFVELNSGADAHVLGLVVAGGRVDTFFDSDGRLLGRAKVFFSGDSALRVTAAHQIKVGLQLQAGKTINLVGGVDPIEADPPGGGLNLSGRGIVILGSGQLATLRPNGAINLNGPGRIDILAPGHTNEIEPAAYILRGDGKLAADVTLALFINKVDFTYSGLATITVAAASDNNGIADLVADIQRAIEAATYTVLTSNNVGHAVGSNYTHMADDPDTAGVVDPDIKVRIRDGKVLLTSPYKFEIRGASVNAHALGFNTAFGAITSSIYYAIYAPGVGSVVTLGAPAGPNGKLYIGGKVLAHTAIALYTGESADGVDIKLDYTGVLETLAGSIQISTLQRGELLGDIIAAGVGSDIILNTTQSIIIGGKLQATRNIQVNGLGAVLPGVVNLQIDGTASILSVGGGGRIEINAVNDVFVGGVVGPGSAGLAAIEINSTNGLITIGQESGRVETAASLLINGRDVLVAGLVSSDYLTGASGDFEVLISASRDITITGTVLSVGALKMDAGRHLAIYDATIAPLANTQSITIASAGTIALGRVATANNHPTLPNGRRYQQGALIHGYAALSITAAGALDALPGVQLLASAEGAPLSVEASEIGFVGAALAGARLDGAGAAEWISSGGRVMFTAAHLITLGGVGVDGDGEDVVRGASIRATQSVVFTVSGGNAGLSVAINSNSRVETDITGGGVLAAGPNPSSIQINAAGDIRHQGSLEAMDTGADIHLTSAGLVHLDGYVGANDSIFVTGGQNADGLGVYLGTLVLLRDAASGRLLDENGRLTDEDGFLVNAAGQFVDEENFVVGPANAVLGGAPVRLSGGVLDTSGTVGQARKIVISSPGKMMLDGTIGNVFVQSGVILVDVRSVEIRGGGDITIGGDINFNERLLVEDSNVGFLEGARVRGRLSGALIDIFAPGHNIMSQGGANPSLVETTGRIHFFGGVIDLAGVLVTASGSDIHLSAVSVITIAGTVSSGDDFKALAGVSASSDPAVLLSGSLTHADLGPALFQIVDEGAVASVANAEVIVGGDLSIRSSVSMGDGQVIPQRPIITTEPKIISVVVGQRQVANGFIIVPEVHWVTTQVIYQVGTEQVKIGDQFHTFDFTLTQDGYWNGTTKREYFVEKIDYNNSDGAINWAAFGVGAPSTGTVFGDLSDAQRSAVLARLGYKRLFNLSYSNPLTHRVVNGITSQTPWTPPWANSAIGTFNINHPSLSDKWIVMRSGAMNDLLRIVSQGSPTTFSENVGQYYDQAKVKYTQDKSAHLYYFDGDHYRETDYDGETARWDVTYNSDGKRWYEIYDGRTGASKVQHSQLPIWNSATNSFVGTDLNGVRIQYKQGYTSSSRIINSQTSAGSHSETVGEQQEFLYTIRFTLTRIYHDIDTESGAEEPYVLASALVYGATDTFPFVQTYGTSTQFTKSWGDGGPRTENPNHTLAYATNVPHTASWALHMYTYEEDDGNADDRFFDLSDSGNIVTKWYSSYKMYGDQGDDGYAEMVTTMDRTGDWVRTGYISETYNDSTYNWESIYTQIYDTRTTLRYQYVTTPIDILGERPKYAAFDTQVKVVTNKTVTLWTTELITQDEVVFVTQRIFDPGEAKDFGAFGQDALRAGGRINIKAVGDINVSGVVNAYSSGGMATLEALGGLTVEGSVPEGSAVGTVPARAEVRAKSKVVLDAVDLLRVTESGYVTADGTGGSNLGEIYLSSDTSVEVDGELLGNSKVDIRSSGDAEVTGVVGAGHDVVVQAGTAGSGDVIGDIYTNLYTFSGSTITLTAGSVSGRINLAQSTLSTGGTLTLNAPAGDVFHSGGAMGANSVVVNALSGFQANLNTSTLAAVLSGAGNVVVLNAKPLTISSIVAPNGYVSVRNVGNLVASSISALGGGDEDDILLTTLQPATGTSNITLGNVQAAGEGDLVLVIRNGGFSMTGAVAADEFDLTVPSGVTITPTFNKLAIKTTGAGNVVINRTNGVALHIRRIDVLDGSATVSTNGHLTLDQVVLRTNRDSNDIAITAQSGLSLGQVNAGLFAKTLDEATAIRLGLLNAALRGAGYILPGAADLTLAGAQALPSSVRTSTLRNYFISIGFTSTQATEEADALYNFTKKYTSLGDVTLTVTGAITLQDIGEGVPSVVTDELRLSAGSVPEIWIATNSIPQFTVATGDIVIHEIDGEGELNQGVVNLNILASTGAIYLDAEESIEIYSVSAPGSGKEIRIISIGGSVRVVNRGAGVNSISGGGLIALEALNAVIVDGNLNSTGGQEFRGTSLLVGDTATITTPVLRLEADVSFEIDSSLNVSERLELVTNAGNIRIRGGLSAGTMKEIVLVARGNRVTEDGPTKGYWAYKDSATQAVYYKDTHVMGEGTIYQLSGSVLVPVANTSSLDLVPYLLIFRTVIRDTITGYELFQDASGLFYTRDIATNRFYNWQDSGGSRLYRFETYDASIGDEIIVYGTDRDPTRGTLYRNNNSTNQITNRSEFTYYPHYTLVANPAALNLQPFVREELGGNIIFDKEYGVNASTLRATETIRLEAYGELWGEEFDEVNDVPIIVPEALDMRVSGANGVATLLAGESFSVSSHTIRANQSVTIGSTRYTKLGSAILGGSLTANTTVVANSGSLQNLALQGNTSLSITANQTSAVAMGLASLGAISTSAATVTANTLTVVGGTSVNLATAVVDLSVTTSKAGNVSISELNGLNLLGASIFGGTTTITASTVSINGAAQFGSGSTTISATLGTGTINAPVKTRGGAFTMTAGAGILFNNGGFLDTESGSSAVILTADFDNDGVGTFNINEGSYIQARGGSVTLRSAGVMNLLGVTTTGVVSLTSTHNSVRGGVVSGSSVSVSANNGIGVASPLLLSASTVSLSTGSGDIYAENTRAGAVTFSNAATGWGSVRVRQADASSVAFSTVAATGGNAYLELLSAGTLTLTALSGAQSATVVSAGSVVLNGAISLAAPNVAGNSGVHIESATTLSMMSPASITGGGGMIRLLAGGDITIRSINAAAAGVAIVSSGGSILDGGDSALDVIAGKLYLGAGADAGVLGASPNALELGVSNLALVVGGGFNLAVDRALGVTGVGFNILKFAFDGSSVYQTAASHTGLNAVASSKLALSAGDLNMASFSEIVVSGVGSILTLQLANSFATSVVSVASGSLNLAVGGSVSDVLPFESPNFVVGSRMTATTVSGFGSLAEDIDLAVTELDLVNSTSGAIVFDQTGDLTLVRLAQQTSAVVSIRSHSGNITLLAAGLGGGGLSATSGQVTILADGTNALISLNHTLQTTSGGPVQIASAGGISMGSAGRVQLPSASLALAANGGAIHMADGAVIAVSAGSAVLNATGDVRVARIETSGTLDITAGFGPSVVGMISDTTSAEALNIVSGGVLTLRAESGIGGPGDLDLDFSAPEFTMLNATSGNVHLNTFGNIVIGDAGMRTLGGNGDITLLVSTGNLTVSGPVNAHGSGNVRIRISEGNLITEEPLEATGTGSLVVDVDLGDVVFGAPVTANGPSDLIITVPTGSLTINAPVTASGSVNVVITVSNGNLNLDNVISSESGSISVTALAITLRDDAALLTGGPGGVELVATTGSITVDPAALIQTEGGNVAFNAAVDVLMGNITSVSGSISATAGSSVQLTGSNWTTGGSGSVSIHAVAGSVLMDAASRIQTRDGGVSFNAGVDVQAGDVTSSTGSISATAGRSVLMTDTQWVTGGAGAVDVVATSGSFVMDASSSIQAAQGRASFRAGLDVTLADVTTTSGDIVMVAGRAGQVVGDLHSTSGSVRLDGGSTLTHALGATIVTAASGEVLLRSLGGTLSVQGSITNGTGPVTLGSSANVLLSGAILSTSGAVQVTAASDLVQTSGGSITTGGLGAVALLASAGAITLDANITNVSGAVGLTAGAAIAVNGDIRSVTGVLTVLAGLGYTQGPAADLVTGGSAPVSITALSGSILLADGSTVVNSAGALTLSATADVGVSTVSSVSGNILVTAGAGPSVAGSIFDTTLAEGSNFSTSGTLTLTAETGIGAPGAAGDLDLNVGFLTASTAVVGGIYLRELNGLFITPDALRVLAGNGSIELVVAAGNLGISGEVSAAGSGSITLAAEAGQITVDATIVTKGGSISVIGTAVTQRSSISTQQSGSILVRATTAAIFMADGVVTGSNQGAITYDAKTNVTVSVLSNSAGGITITAQTGAVVDGTFGEGTNVTSGGLVAFSAATGIGKSTTNADIDISAASLQAVNATSGGIYIQEFNDILIAAAGVRTLAGNGPIHLSNQFGPMTLNGPVVAHGSGSVTVAAPNGLLTVNAAVGSTSGAVAVSGQQITLNVALSISSPMTLAASGGAFLMGAVASITTGGNPLGISASGDITVTTINTGAAALTLTTTGGAVLDGNGASLNVTAGNLTLQTAKGANLDTAVASLTASATGAGSLAIRELDSLDTISATAAAGNVSISNLSGDLKIGWVSASGSVTLTSAGAIDELGADAAVDLSAASTVLSAALGIGGAGAIETQVGALSITASNGAVAIDNTWASGLVNLSNLRSTNGDIDFTQRGGASLGLLSGSTNRSATITVLNGASASVSSLSAAVTQTWLVDGSFEELNPDTGIDLGGNMVVVRAGGAVGGFGAIELSTWIIDVIAGSAINLENRSGGTTTLRNLETAGAVTYLKTLGGSENAERVRGSNINLNIVGATASLAVGDVVGTGTVTLTAGAAVNELGADAGVDVAAGGLLSISAGTAIGATGAIEIAAGALSLVASNGLLAVDNTWSSGSVNAAAIRSTNGDLTFTQRGGSNLNVTSGSSTKNGSITVLNGASLWFNSINASLTLTLTVDGSVEELSPDAGIDVGASAVVIRAGGAVGGIDAMEFSTWSVDVVAGTIINLENRSGGTTTVKQLVGAGNVTYLKSGGGSEQVQTARGLNVTLTVAGTADLMINAATATQTLTLTAGRHVEEWNPDPGIDLGGNLTVVRAGGNVGGQGAIELSTWNVDVVSGGVINLENRSGGTTTVRQLDAVGNVTYLKTGGGSEQLQWVRGANVSVNVVGAAASIFAGDVAATGSVTLGAGAAVNELGADAGVDIRAGTLLTITAATGVGVTGAIEVAYATQSIITAAGPNNTARLP